MSFIPVMAKLQSSESHDSSEIILIFSFAAQDTFIIIDVEHNWTVALLKHFVETVTDCQFWLI